MWSTVASWAVLITVGVAAAYYYQPDLFRKHLPSNPNQPQFRPVNSQPTKKRSKKSLAARVNGEEKDTSTPTSSNDAPVSKKRKIVSPPVDQTVTVTSTNGETVALPRDKDGNMKDKEFAQQLFKAQQGTTLEKKQQQQASKKDKRTPTMARQDQKGVESPNISTDTASNADDDLSPIATPSSGVDSTAPTSRAGDISDMLEAPAAKPTTLRLTNIEPSKSNANSFQKVESKKAKKPSRRQEEERAMKADADRLYEQKKQEQMRQARMADGSSKQTRADGFASRQNAWQKPPELPRQPQQSSLLDTFDPSETPKTKANGAVHTQPLADITNGPTKTVNAVKEEQGQGKTEALAASSREGKPELDRRPSWADEMIEDEKQNQWAKQLVQPTQEEEWSTVTNKKGKKIKKKDTDTSSEASFSLGQQPSRSNGFQNSEQNKSHATNRFASVEGDAWEA